MEIRQIPMQAALEFFLEFRGFREHVTFTQVGDWFGAFEGDSMQGIVSTQQIGKWRRIKTLYVSPKARRKGVATALVAHASAGVACTAFAFDASRPAFLAAGFELEKTQRNGVHFMRKQA